MQETHNSQLNTTSPLLPPSSSHHKTFEALLLYNTSPLLCIPPDAARLANEQTNTQ